MTMKIAVFWNITRLALGENRRLEGTYHLHYQGDMNW
jgi:hypothetical protein